MSVTVTTNRHGYLVLRIGHKGRRPWIGTKLRDDGKRGENRRVVERMAVLIEDALARGRELHEALTDVVGECPPRLLPDRPRKVRQGITLGEVVEEFYRALEADRPVRRSLLQKTRVYLDAVIVPYWKDVPLVEIDLASVERFKTAVLSRKVRRRDPETKEITEQPLRAKTTRNIVGGHLKKLLRWCRKTYRLPVADPFDGIEWKRERRPEPDPYSAEERDLIVGHYRDRKPFWFVWVNTLFWTGMRQGESTALRLSDFDELAGTVRITKSRSAGEENAPKTERSTRTIRLMPEALGPLREYVRSRLVFDPGAYLFQNPEGRPINHVEWPKKSFYPVLKKLRVRPRVFYSTRHTFISEMLRRGHHPKAIAEYCGTSVAMIERSYGRFFPKSLDGGVATLGEAKMATFGSPLPEVQAVGDGTSGVSRGYGVVPRGIEPPNGSSSVNSESPKTRENPDSAASPVRKPEGPK